MFICLGHEYDDTVVGIALHGDYGVVLDTAAKTPNEILKGLQKEIKKGAGNDEIACTQDGSDGLGGASGHRCAIWTASLNQPVIIRYLLQNVDKSTISNPFTVFEKLHRKQ